MNLKSIVEDTDTTPGRAFDCCIQVLIVISLVSFCLETLPDLSPRVRGWLYVVEVVTVVLFTAEYLLRICVADRKLRFIFSFYGLVDLLAILPFYMPGRSIDLRAVRILRLLRLVRAFKLLRYTQAIERFRRAFADIKEELVLFAITTVLILFLASVGIYYFENPEQPEAFKSIFHCMWWSICTLTTVGYGDVYPVTAGGKIFTGVLLLLSLGVVAVPSGLLASALTRTSGD